MIPKIIWQTYESKYNQLLPEINKCIESWTIQNPEWKHIYMDAEERDYFVLNEFGEEWHSLFTKCDLGVVKANIWRCMVTYIYGGVYCDLDTICNQPIDSWIKNKYDLVISHDDDGNPNDFAIHTFAAAPNNKILKQIIDQIKVNLQNNTISKESVIELTGETVWSKVINNNKENNIYIYQKGSNIFNGVAITHLGTSKQWYKNGYNQWFRKSDDT